MNRSGLRNKGFTLIELVVVIVVLGVLAAVSLPKFVDLSEQAHIAKIDSIASALTTASFNNYLLRKTPDRTDFVLVFGSLSAGGVPVVARLMGPGYAKPANYTYSVVAPGCDINVPTATVIIKAPTYTTHEAAATLYCVS